MTAGILLALVLGVAVLAFVVAPLLRDDAAEAEQYSGQLSAARELHSEQEMLLSALKDLEEDRATDKIGEEDYRSLHERLSLRAVEVMRRLDELAGERRELEEAAERAARPLRHPGSAPRGPVR